MNLFDQIVVVCEPVMGLIVLGLENLIDLIGIVHVMNNS